MFSFIGQFLDATIITPITNLLLVIYNFVGDFSLTIIVFTLIVKLCMWPLVKKQFKQARLMRKIQPELAEIRKNAKGNRMVEQMQMMDLYKRNNVKPFSSILTLVVQLPIFFALFWAITTVVPTTNEKLQEHPVEQKAYSFVADMPRVREIIEQQQSAETIEAYEFRPELFGIIDLSAHALESPMTISSVVVLFFALLSALSQYWVAKQQIPTSTKKKTFKQIMKEAADGKDPDQSELNAVVSGQMSKFMPIMMLLIMINLIGALSFYYFISNLITIIQQKTMLNKELDQLDASADKTIMKELKKAEEAVIVKDSTKPNKKSNKNITRISVSDNKKRRK
jgi:YidC/Oxa1 family membrane protein insertase